MIDLDRSIGLAVKTGKVLYGANSALENAKMGKVRLIIRAASCPEKCSRELEYYCRLSNIPLIVYNGTGKDLGVVCGKPYAISVLAVREAGDSDILKVAEGG